MDSLRVIQTTTSSDRAKEATRFRLVAALLLLVSLFSSTAILTAATTTQAGAALPAANTPPNKDAYIYDTFDDPSTVDDISQMTQILHSEGYSPHAFENPYSGAVNDQGTATLKNFKKMAGAGVIVILTHGNDTPSGLVAEVFPTAVDAYNARCKAIKTGLLPGPVCSPGLSGIGNSYYLSDDYSSIGAACYSLGGAAPTNFEFPPPFGPTPPACSGGFLQSGGFLRYVIILKFPGIQYLLGDQPVGIVMNGACLSASLQSAFNASSYYGYPTDANAQLLGPTNSLSCRTFLGPMVSANAQPKVRRLWEAADLLCSRTGSRLGVTNLYRQPSTLQ